MAGLTTMVQELATLTHARRQLREHYLVDVDSRHSAGNAANAWFDVLAEVGHADGNDAEDSDDTAAECVESALWSSRTEAR